MRKLLVCLTLSIACLRCESQNKNGSALSNPEKVFEEYWQLMDDHYAFFELRKVNWKQQYSKFRPKVNASTTDDELLQILSEMISPLKDGHTSIYYKGVRHRSGGHAPIWDQAGNAKSIVKKNYLKGVFKERAGGVITYGWLNATTGYIGITAMEGYSPDEIDPVLVELQGASHLIVDVRFNGGGYDETSLRMADRFADKPRLAYSKETFYKGKMNEHKDLYIRPHPSLAFNGELILLTNQASFSAAEMFIMAMTTLPNCTVIGENSAGAHSDVMQSTLSNGWRVGLSNQVYTMPDGKVYEMIGIPPDIFVKGSYEGGRDAILEHALSTLK